MRGRAFWVVLAVAALGVGALVTVRTGAAFSSASGNPGNLFAAAPDFVAPTVNRTVIAESTGDPTYLSEVLADSPLGYWRLGEIGGTTTADSSGNGRSGTYAGTYTLGATGAINSLNPAVTLAGAGSVDIASTTLQPSTAVTVEAWVQPTSSCGNCTIFEKSANGTANTSVTMDTGGGRFKCRVYKATTKYEIQSNANFTAGAWAHLACAWDGTTLRMYVDGAQQTATKAVASPIDTGTGSSRIGRLVGGTNPFYGTIDEVSIYGSGLSATRIAAHYNAGLGAYPDAVRACHNYYTYADVTDSGNPASGVASVTANLSSLSSGQSAVSLSSGAYSLQGTTYGYRSGARLATSAAGSYTYSLTSVDNAASSRLQNGFPATIVAGNAAAVSAVFLTGLEQGVAAPTAPGVFDTVTGSGVSADAATRRNGTYSLRVAPANASAVASVSLGGSSGVAVARFAISLASLPAASVDLAAISGASGSTAWFVYDSSSGRFGVRWGSGTVTTGTVAPAAGTWYVVDVRADFAGPHTLSWRIDGTAQAAATAAEAAANAASLSFGTTASNVTFTANFDDIIASLNPADYPIGNGAVLALAVNGVGTHRDPQRFLEDDETAIDANTWNRVDEVPATSIADYVKQISSNNAAYVEFTFQDTAETCISAVGARLAYHSAAGSTNYGKTSIFGGTAESIVYAGDMTGLVNPLGYRRATVTPPAGGWTAAAVNALVARVGYSSDISPIPYYDALLLEYNVITSW